MERQQVLDVDSDQTPEPDENFEITDDPKIVVEASEDLARLWMGKFFEGKELYCGGSIPNGVLFSPRYINLVLRLNIEGATVIAYRAMEIENGGPFASKMGGISDDIRWVISFLRRCNAMRIPPCFVGGLMCVYLELCDGVPLPTEMLAGIIVT